MCDGIGIDAVLYISCSPATLLQDVHLMGSHTGGSLLEAHSEIELVLKKRSTAGAGLQVCSIVCPPRVFVRPPRYAFVCSRSLFPRPHTLLCPKEITRNGC